MWRYIIFLILSMTLKGEYLVEVKNVKAESIHNLEQSGKVDVVNYRNGTLIAIVYDNGSILKTNGYHYTILRDLTLDRQHWYKIKGKEGWHTYSQYITHFDSLATNHPDICKLDTLGFTTDASHWPILCLKISDNPQEHEFEPEIRYVGVHHGNEQVSGELLYRYAAYLVHSYGSDPEVTYIVNNREIYIIPVLNPYGYEHDTRRNENGVDLNRDYGYLWDGSGGSSEPYSQPETRMIYEHAQKHNFTVSLTYHSGAFYVNYPWNYTPVRLPDNPFLYAISAAYADSTNYPLTEGYDWYQTRGDLNDYSYGIDSDLDVTIELYDPYDPPASELDSIFLLNRGAMNMWAIKGGQGIGGFVIDSTTGDTIKEARIYVEGIDWPVYTDRITGDFIKVLLPGIYTIRVEANGYVTKTISNIEVFNDSLTHIDVYLQPGGGKYAFKPVMSVVVADNYSRIPRDTILVGNMLGQHDGKFYYLGIGGYVVLDMGENGIANGYLKVYEGDDGAPDEGYYVYGSNNWNGPWTLIGNGHGTEDFTFNGSYRYIKVVDDGDGSESAPNPGFDLDAIETARPTTPYFVLSNVIFDDSQGNGNGIPDPGETLDFIFTVKNVGADTASNVYFKILPGDNYLTISNDSIYIGTIYPNDSTVDTVTFSVDPNCPRAHDDYITISVHYDNSTQNMVHSFQVGQLTQYDPTGPDNYGYYAVENVDSTSPARPSFSWIEISSMGTNLNLGDDETQTVSLPFSFTYYGHSYNSISICSNGFIAMGSTSEHPYSNSALPHQDNIIMVAPFWDDLNPNSSGAVLYYYDTQNHKFIIEWSQVPHYGGSQGYTFEVIFFDPQYYPTSTGDGLILFQYRNVPDASSSTIGIENPSESDALQYWYNGQSDVTVAGPTNGRAVLFTTSPDVAIYESPLHQISLKFAVSPTAVFGQTNIRFAIPTASEVNLNIYDVSGKIVRRILNSKLPAGVYKFNWNASGRNGARVPAGVYFVSLRVNGKRLTKKILVIGNKNRR